jgi:hypothetical protein
MYFFPCSSIPISSKGSTYPFAIVAPPGLILELPCGHSEGLLNGAERDHVPDYGCGRPSLDVLEHGGAEALHVSGVTQHDLRKVAACRSRRAGDRNGIFA